MRNNYAAFDRDARGRSPLQLALEVRAPPTRSQWRLGAHDHSDLCAIAVERRPIERSRNVLPGGSGPLRRQAHKGPHPRGPWRALRLSWFALRQRRVWLKPPCLGALRLRLRYDDTERPADCLGQRLVEERSYRPPREARPNQPWVPCDRSEANRCNSPNSA
jgi:hypothetical protein